MAARKARDGVSTPADLDDAERVVSPSLRLAEDDDTSVSSGAHALLLQIQSIVDVEESAQRRASPARGILIALIPSALVWWGVVAGVRALIEHGR